jgi:hypothetical protein
MKSKFPIMKCAKKKQGKHERTGKKVVGTARFGIGNCVSICIKLL